MVVKIMVPFWVPQIFSRSPTVDSKLLEYGPRMIYAGVPSSEAFGIGGQSYSNFLASTFLGGP